MTGRWRPAVQGAAWAAGSAVIALAFLACTGDVPAGSRALASSAAACLLASLVLPAVSIAFASRAAWGSRRRRQDTGGAGDVLAPLVLWWYGIFPVFAGGATGLVAYALIGDARGVAPVLVSLLVASACGASLGGAAWAMTRLLPGGRAGALVAEGLLAALVAVPFWSRPLLAAGAIGRAAVWLVGASPFLAAAIPWRGGVGGFAFDPVTSRVLYRLWVGTDYPVAFPSVASSVLGHLVAACLLVGVAEAAVAVRGRRREAASR
jgi:hypothetical protein